MIGELELAWRLLANEFVAVTGTNGKTTTVELLGAIHRAAGLRGAVAGNVGARAASAARPAPLAPDDDDRLRGLLVPARGHRRASRPTRPCCSNLAPDHLDRHGDMEPLRRGEAARSSPTRAPDDLAVAAGRSGPPAAAAPRAGDLRRVARGADLRDDGDAAALARRAADRRRASCACAARTTARTRWRRPRWRWRAGSRATPSREALATFRRRRPPPRGGRERRGVLYVNDSKATNVASTLVALRAFEPGSVHLILGGRGTGQDFARAARATVAARAARGLPDRRGGAGDRRGARAALRARRLRHARARASPPRARGRRARRGRPAEPGLQELRPVPRLRGARRGVPRLLVG